MQRMGGAGNGAAFFVPGQGGPTRGTWPVPGPEVPGYGTQVRAMIARSGDVTIRAAHGRKDRTNGMKAGSVTRFGGLSSCPVRDGGHLTRDGPHCRYCHE